MTWTYEQLTGKLRDPEGNVVGIGYSGHGEYKNRPEFEHLVSHGPIPAGRYRVVGPPTMTKQHGPFVLRLDPDTPTRERIVAMGRDPDSFLMHGDSIAHAGTASLGCIIQDRGTRERVWKDNPFDPDFEVVSGITYPDIDGEISV